MQRIFKYGDIQNTNITPDKELNILIYRMLSCIITCRCYTLLKMVLYFWSALYIYVQVFGMTADHGSFLLLCVFCVIELHWS